MTSTFSGYTTYKGFSYDLPFLLSVILAFIVGFSLMIINFVIKNYAANNNPLSRPLTAFFLIFIFSFVSNTNAIYSYFLKNNIVQHTHENAWKDFYEGTDNILIAIDNLPAIQKHKAIKSKLSKEKLSLKTQILDTRNPGLGEKARQHLRAVENILEFKTTRLKPPSNDSHITEYNHYAKRLMKLIDEQFENKYGSKVAKKHRFREEILRLRAENKKPIINEKYSSLATNKIKRDMESLGTKAKSIINNFNGNIPEINNIDDEIGPFKYTWQNFSEWINPIAIILSIFLSILLDIISPLLVILLRNPTEEDF